ncbi:MAG: hypothetical protein ACI81R_000804 [Bradymonadia bacterium]|jgi:uncharacterized protein (TIGR00255 family)
MTTLLQSMTGFGEGSASVGKTTVNAQLRSVNHKTFDARFTAPTVLQPLEATCVARLKSLIKRGRVELRFSLSSEQGGLTARAATLADELRALAKAADIEAQVTLRDLVQAGLYSSDAEPADASDASGAALLALDAALHQLLAFRTREGEALRHALDEHLETIEASLLALDPLIDSEMTAYVARLRARIADLLPQSMEVDDNRVLQEAALVAQRADIAEERQRAAEHLKEVRSLLQQTGPHGKQLDFMLQELIRETNTMASKSNSATMTHVIVHAKTAIERMREQAPNLE